MFFCCLDPSLLQSIFKYSKGDLEAEDSDESSFEAFKEACLDAQILAKWWKTYLSILQETFEAHLLCNDKWFGSGDNEWFNQSDHNFLEESLKYLIKIFKKIFKKNSLN